MKRSRLMRTQQPSEVPQELEGENFFGGMMNFYGGIMNKAVGKVKKMNSERREQQGQKQQPVDRGVESPD